MGVLAQLLKGEEANIGYYDDPKWEQFPEIGETLKEHGPAADAAGPSSHEEQLTIAVTKSGNAWSVGFGSDWKSQPGREDCPWREPHPSSCRGSGSGCLPAVRR